MESVYWWSTVGAGGSMWNEVTDDNNNNGTSLTGLLAGWPMGGLTCLKPTLSLGPGMTIYDPELIPVMAAGIAVGWYSFKTMRPLNVVRGHIIYALAFLFFACMNFFAFWADCVAKSGWIGGAPTNRLAPLVAIADGICSSLINVSLIMLGIVDVGILNESSKFFRLLISLVYTAVVVGWYYTITQHSIKGFMFLYATLAEYAFLIFPVLSLLFLIQHRKKGVFLKGLFWITATVASGLAGFAVLLNGDKVCKHTVYWLPPEALWFLFSFLSMFSISGYFFYTQDARISDEDKAMIRSNSVQLQLEEQQSTVDQPPAYPVFYSAFENDVNHPVENGSATYVQLQQINGLFSPPPMMNGQPGLPPTMNGLYGDLTFVSSSLPPLQYTVVPVPIPQINKADK